MMECSGGNRRAMAEGKIGWRRVLGKRCVITCTNFVEVVMVFGEESGGAARCVV